MACALPPQPAGSGQRPDDWANLNNRQRKALRKQRAQERRRQGPSDMIANELTQRITFADRQVPDASANQQQLIDFSNFVPPQPDFSVHNR